MRTLCKSGLEIATALYPKRMTYYLLVPGASEPLAAQLPPCHPPLSLLVDVPDHTTPLLDLGALDLVCSWCEQPVQTEHSDQLDFGQLVHCDALCFHSWPFSWCKSLPRTRRNLVLAPLHRDRILIWSCKVCTILSEPRTVFASESDTDTSETESFVASCDNSASEVSEEEEAV